MMRSAVSVCGLVVLTLATKTGSTVVFSAKTGPSYLLMDLVMDNGELFVCSRW